MHFTRFTDYGLRTLIFLAARPERLASIGEIAGAYRISENHMMKVIQRLGQAGLIETIRGRHGGIRLARPAEKIGLGDVIRATEADLAPVDCGAGGGCAILEACRLRWVMNEAVATMLGVFDRYTIADIVTPAQAALRRSLGLEAEAETN